MNVGVYESVCVCLSLLHILPILTWDSLVEPEKQCNSSVIFPYSHVKFPRPTECTELYIAL